MNMCQPQTINKTQQEQALSKSTIVIAHAHAPVTLASDTLQNHEGNSKKKKPIYKQGEGNGMRKERGCLYTTNTRKR